MYKEGFAMPIIFLQSAELYFISVYTLPLSAGTSDLTFVITKLLNSLEPSISTHDILT